MDRDAGRLTPPQRRPPAPTTRRWAVIVAAWTLVGVFLFSHRYVLAASAGTPFDAWPAFARVFADAYLWAALTPLILALAQRFPVRRETWRRAVPLHVLAAALIGAFTVVAGWLVALLVQPDQPNVLIRLFAVFFHYNFEWYWIVLGAGHAIDYYRRYHERALHASELEAQLATAQLQALRMQLQPHFLFNTLHVISELVHEDAHAADRMITRLGDLLRLSVDAVGTHEVSLRQELEFLEAYLEIERTRFQDHLAVDLVIEPDTLDAQVPNLILQPLVENAIKHGLARSALPGRLAVSARRCNGTLELEVRDNGAGLGGGPIARAGVGLRNTRARLQRMYGAEHRFDVRDHPAGGVIATVAIPFRAPARGGAEPVAAP